MAKFVLLVIVIIALIYLLPGASAALINGCAVVNDSSSLTANVTSNGTCITINASNLFFNCTGFTIHFDQDGSGGDGIFVQHQTNVTIRNCIILDINVSGSFGIGINFSNITNSLALNNSIQTNGTSNSVGIVFTNGTGNQMINNTIHTLGSAANNFGIWGVNTFTYINVTNNTITTNGTNSGQPIRFDAPTHNVTISNNVLIASGTGNSNSGMRLTTNIRDYTIMENTINTSGATSSNVGIVVQIGGNHVSIIRNTINTNGTSGNTGIWFNVNIDNSTIAHNTIRTSGTATGDGILIDTSVLNNITNNTINTSGSSDSNRGMLLSTAERNNITNNTITASGSQLSDGIRFDASSHNNILTGNNITTSGNLSFVIAIFYSNGSLINNTIFTRPAQWINSTSNVLNNFSNTTFQDLNGRIRIPGVIEIVGQQNITYDKLNVTRANRAFLNSTNLTFLNTSAQITLTGITDVDPVPRIDFDDDGVFANCPSTICTETGYANQEYSFNVTQFTTFSSTAGNANVTLSKTDSQDPVNNGSLLTYTINVSNNGTSNATNINLTDVYPSVVIFNATTGTLVGSTNDTFLIGNLSSGQSSQFTITVRVVTGALNLTIMYNTVNITYTNDSGVQSALNVTESTNITPTSSSTGGSVSGGGGGGGGGAGTTLSMTTDIAQFVTRRSDRINLNVNNILHTITVLQIYTDRILIRAASTPQEFVIAAGKSQLIDFEKDGTLDVRVTVISISYNQATLKIEKLISSCVESWTCEAWSACENGQQSRSCVDLNNCGSTKNKPSESQSCTAAAPEPAPAVPETVPEAPETPVEEEVEEAPTTEEYLDTSDMLTKLFYGLAILALVVFGAYWYYARKN